MKTQKLVLMLVVLSLLCFVYSCGVVRVHIGKSRLDEAFEALTADGDMSDSDVMALIMAWELDQEDAAQSLTLLKGLGSAATGDWTGVIEKIGLGLIGTGAVGYGAHKLSARAINRSRDASRKTALEGIKT